MPPGRVGRPSWYVVEDVLDDPARFVAGPVERERAKQLASMRSPSGELMHVAMLVYSVQSLGYRVEFRESADRPRSLRSWPVEEGSA